MTPPEPDLTPADRLRLLNSSFDRLRTSIKALRGCTLAMGSDAAMLVVVDAGQLSRLQQQWIDLRLKAYFICGAKRLSLYCGNNRIMSASTLPLIPTLSSCHRIEEILNKTELEPMVATAEKPRISRRNGRSPAAQSTDIESMPVRDMLSSLGKKTGQPIEQIALSILEQLPRDQAMPVLTQYIDRQLEEDLERYRAERRSELLGLLPNKAEAEPKAKSPKPRTARKTSSTTVRFKSFVPTTRPGTTIGKFLEAQGYDSTRRIEVIEQLGALPATPPSQPEALETFAEQALNAILKRMPAKKRDRKSLIQAAQKMQGKETPVDEAV